jgi:putative transposase
MGRSRYKQIEGLQTYFATNTVVGWLPLFAKPELAQVVLNSLKYLHEEKIATGKRHDAIVELLKAHGAK